MPARKAEGAREARPFGRGDEGKTIAGKTMRKGDEGQFRVTPVTQICTVEARAVGVRARADGAKGEGAGARASLAFVSAAKDPEL